MVDEQDKTNGELPKILFSYSDSYTTINISCSDYNIDTAMNGLIFLVDELKLRQKLNPPK